jgi:hypothetical protein
MSDSDVDAVADRISPDAATFASLSLPLACRIFLALPADARGRASCVCRAWRDALAEPSLWTRLDMSFMRINDAEWQRLTPCCMARLAARTVNSTSWTFRAGLSRWRHCCRC